MKKTAYPTTPPPGRWNRLKALRRARGLSQTQLAIGAGVVIVLITELEGALGSRRKKRAEKRIAAYLGCKPEEVFPAEMIGAQTLDEFIAQALKDREFIERLSKDRQEPR